MIILVKDYLKQGCQKGDRGQIVQGPRGLGSNKNKLYFKNGINQM